MSSIDKALYCSSCNTLYRASNQDSRNLGSRALPLLLKCGHTFCESCIRKSYKAEGSQLPCPTCQVETCIESDELLLQTLPVDVHVLGLSVVKKSSHSVAEVSFDRVGTILKPRPPDPSSLTEKENCELCSECCRAEAAVTCVKCESNVCRRCFDKIHQAKVLRKHKAIPLQKEEEQLTCGVHRDRPVEYYCEDDETAICSRCYIVGDHRNHTITPLEEKNKSVLSSLEPAIEGATKFVRKSRRTLKVLTSLMPEWRCELEKKISEINSQFHVLHSQLQLREHEMIEELRESFSESTIPLPSIRKEMEEDVQKYERLVKTARRLLTGPDIVINSAQVVQQLVGAVDRPCGLQAPPKIQADLRFDFDLTQMKASIAGYGQITVPERKKSYRLMTLSDFPEDDDDAESVTSSVSTSADIVIEDDSSVSDTVSVSSSTGSTSRPASRGSRPSRNIPQRRLAATDEDEDSASGGGAAKKSAAQKSSKPAKVLKRTELAPAKLDSYRTEIVSVCHIKNPCHFLVHMQTGLHRLEVMSADINRWCKSVDGKKQPPLVEVDGLYLGQFTGDSRWYRCRVKALSETTEGVKRQKLAHVHYVDYGNSEVIPLSRLRIMPARFYREPEFAIRCSLVEIVPANGDEWSEQANNNFARMTVENTMHLVVIHHVHDTLFVDLARPPSHDVTDDQPISVRDALVFLELANFVSPQSLGLRSSIKERQYLPRDIPETGDRLNGFVCHMDTPDSFYIQTVGEEVTYLSTMCQSLQNKYNADKNDVWTVFCPALDMICVAKMLSDNCWYRARVTGLPGGRLVEVSYVDYGNSEVVSIWDLKKITDEFLILPPQALKCSLADVQPLNDGQWTPEALLEFSSLALHKLINLDVKERKLDGISVLAYEQSDEKERNLNAALVENGHALSTGAGSVTRTTNFNRGKKSDLSALRRKVAEGQEALRRQVEKEKQDIELCIVEEGPEKQFFPVHVSHVVSPGEIYLQNMNTAKDVLDSLKVNLQNEYGKSVAEEGTVWTEGQYTAVRHPDDDAWLRGSILKLTDDKAEVTLLDYGQKVKVDLTALRTLKEEWLTLPCQALKCHLDGVQPAGGDRWSATSRELISETILPPKRCKVLKKGDMVDDSTPVDLVIEEVIPPDALNAARSEHISVSKLLVEKGVALPRKTKSPPPIRANSKPPVVASTSHSDDDDGDDDNDETELNVSEQSPVKKSGTRRVSANRQNERTTYPPMLPPSAPVMNVIPTYLDYECILYVQDPENDADALTLLMDDLQREFADSETEFDVDWKVGQAVTSLFSDDQQWYRGLITDINDKGILVKFVDYGNSEYVHPSRLRSTRLHMTVPKLCYPCVIQGLTTTSGDGVWPVSSLNYIHNLVVAKQTLIEIKEQPMVNQPLVISLKLPDWTDLVEHLIGRGLALRVKAPPVAAQRVTTTPVTTPSVTATPVARSPVKAPSVQGGRGQNFAVSPVLSALIAKETAVSAVEENGVAEEARREESTESDDGIEVQADAKSRSTEIYLSESGHSNSSSSQSNPPSPARPVRSALARPVRAALATDDFESGEPVVVVSPSDAGGPLADGASRGAAAAGRPAREPSEDLRKSWSEMVDESFEETVLEVLPRKSDYTCLQPPGPGQFATYGITNFIAPNLFFAQRTICSDESEEASTTNAQLEALVRIVSELNSEAAAFDRLTADTAVVGKSCCARYSFDQWWYRAEILSVQERYCTVLFVDYGNKETQIVEEVRVLPDKYLDLPAQALLLRVAGLRPAGEAWTDECMDYMQLLASQPCLVKTVDSSQRPPSVALHYDVPTPGEETQLLYQSLVDQGLATIEEPST